MDHLLKDKILHFFNTNPSIYIGSIELAKQLDSDQDEVVRIVELINGDHGDVVRLWPGLSDDRNQLSLMPKRKAFVAHFLSQGGFTAAFESQQTSLAEELEIRALYKENLRLSNQAKIDAQFSAESAKRSERITLIMTIITGIATVVSVIIAWMALK